MANLQQLARRKTINLHSSSMAFVQQICICVLHLTVFPYLKEYCLSPLKLKHLSLIVPTSTSCCDNHCTEGDIFKRKFPASLIKENLQMDSALFSNWILRWRIACPLPRKVLKTKIKRSAKFQRVQIMHGDSITAFYKPSR